MRLRSLFGFNCLCRGIACYAPTNSVLIGIALVLLSSLSLAPLNAQEAGQCGVAERINFPVDVNTFRIVNDFGTPSPRHQGSFHTGEDWYGGRGMSFGQPVRAIANGRVTFSSPTGWGRDGGVIVLEHIMPDGTTVYSQYGHLIETDTRPFPRGLTCVNAGDVIATIGDARPAPHLHFEIRTNNPTAPGGGYFPEMLIERGWIHPSRFIRNWQVWLQPAHEWHVDTSDVRGPAAAPFVLADNSLVVVDGSRVRRVLPDGRILWRITPDARPVGVIGLDGLPVIIDASGRMQLVNLDGSIERSWQTDVALDGPPLVAGEALLLRTADDALVAFAPDLQTIQWRLDNVPPLLRSHVAARTVGLLTERNELLTISLDGRLLNRTQLRAGASLDTAMNGDLLVYTRGGLWTIDANGTWALAIEDAPPGGDSGAILRTLDGRLFLFDGEMLHLYDETNQHVWQVPFVPVTGWTQLAFYDDILLLTSNHGHIVAVRASNGGLCNNVQVYGSRLANQWQQRGSDGILRVAIADQIIGLDWATFVRGCL